MVASTIRIPHWTNRREEHASVDYFSSKGGVDEQPCCHSKCGRTIFSRNLLVVNRCRGGNPVSLDIILAWLWLIGIGAVLVLVGYLLQGRRNTQSSRGSYYLEARLLPDRMELFRQRRQRRKRYLIFNHLSRLN